jgi:hypothetical protein
MVFEGVPLASLTAVRAARKAAVEALFLPKALRSAAGLAAPGQTT